MLRLNKTPQSHRSYRPPQVATSFKLKPTAVPKLAERASQATVGVLPPEASSLVGLSKKLVFNVHKPRQAKFFATKLLAGLRKLHRNHPSLALAAAAGTAPVPAPAVIDPATAAVATTPTAVAATSAITGASASAKLAAAGVAATTGVGFWSSLYYWNQIQHLDASFWNIFYYPLTGLELLLEAAQVATGLPWWSVIVLYGLSIRIVLLPLQIRQVIFSGKMVKLMPLMKIARERFQVKLAAAKSSGRPMPSPFELQTENNAILAKEGLSQWDLAKLGLYQLFPIILFVIGLSRMSRIDMFEPLKTGGALWFTDMTAPDPLFIFPLLSIITTVGLFELSPTTNPNKELMRYVSIGVGVISFFFTLSFPTAMHLFWATTNTFTMAFFMALKNNNVRSMLNIPLSGAAALASQNVVLVDNRPSSGTVASGGHSTAQSLVNRKKDKKKQ